MEMWTVVEKKKKKKMMMKMKTEDRKMVIERLPLTWHDDQLLSPSSPSSANDKEVKKEENMDKKLMVYVLTGSSSGYPSCRWFIINVHPSGTAVDSPSYEEDHKMSDYPPVLSKLQSYANAVCGSKIYFLGGEFRCSYCNAIGDYLGTDILSARVFAFDTITRAWDDDFKSMLSARFGHTAVAVRNKIYVFGNFEQHPKVFSPEHWGECYDTETGSSVYLPQPPRDLYESCGISSHAVYNSEILFWVLPRGCVYMFDFVSNFWRSVNLPIKVPIYLGPCWSKRVAILDDLLFWHYAGTIYAYDFIRKQSFTPCTFDAPYLKKKGEHNPRGDSFSMETFLVHAGEWRLCLVWSDIVEPEVFHCHTFWVERRGEHNLRVVWEASLTFPTDCYGIGDVLAV